MAFSDLIGSAASWIPGAWSGTSGRIVAALLIVALSFLLSKLLRSALHRLRKVFKDAAPFMYIVEQLGAYAIFFMGLVTAATVLGLNLSSLALFGGAVGVGIGLGLQGIVKEFVSGIVLIFDTMVQVGDFVELEGGSRGEVVEIGPRAVRLRTNDDLHVVIPNSRFMQDRVTNWTYAATTRRFHVPFSVAEQSDVALVRDVVLKAARSLSFTLPEDDLHRSQVWLTGFAGAGLQFDLVAWPTVESARHPRSLHAAYTWAIYDALRAAGVQPAQDQMDVRMRGVLGRDDEEVIRLSHPRHGKTQTPPGPSRHAPNDAAAAVNEEADLRRRRPVPRRKRGRADGHPGEA